MVVTAVAYYLIMFILDWVLKKFTVAVNIYNWDPDHNYIISEEYKDNAKIEDGEPFTATGLPSKAGQ
tara:strand:- start:369 stop:569 length:201 start_codon:yes stop_codon:yes gene_type:complete